MKIKMDKQFLEVLGVAAACSAIVTVIFAILSIFSWGVVFAGLLLLFMPIAQGAIKFYKQEKCINLEDFFHRLMEDENKEKHSEIEW